MACALFFICNDVVTNLMSRFSLNCFIHFKIEDTVIPLPRPITLLFEINFSKISSAMLWYTWLSSSSLSGPVILSNVHLSRLVRNPLQSLIFFKTMVTHQLGMSRNQGTVVHKWLWGYFCNYFSPMLGWATPKFSIISRTTSIYKKWLVNNSVNDRNDWC